MPYIDNIKEGVTPVFGVPTTPAETKYKEKDPKHMGVAGVGRDILGTLGDFLLTRMRMPAMYAPAQKQRRLEAAYEGVEQNPEAAIARVTDVDFPTGTKLQEQRTDNLRAATTAADVAEQRAARLALQRTEARNKSRNRAANMFYTLTEAEESKRPALYKEQLARIKQFGADAGFPDLVDDLPDVYTPDILDGFVMENVTPGTQLEKRLAKRRLDIQEEQGGRRIAVSETNAATGKQRADTGDRNTTSLIADRVADNKRADTKANTPKPVKPVKASRPQPTGDDITRLRANPALRDKFDGHFGVGMSKKILGM